MEEVGIRKEDIELEDNGCRILFVVKNVERISEKVGRNLGMLQ